MKKFLILPILIAPIVANADNVGPAAASGTPVIATANAPYATANAETGDSTTVVSASYVKGAYNDAIAAVNKVNSDLSNLSSYVNNDVEDEISGLQDQIDDKQDKFVMEGTGGELGNAVLVEEQMAEYMAVNTANFDLTPSESFFEDKLVSANGVATGIMVALATTGIRAVTTWGSSNTVVVDHVPQD